MNNYFEKEIDRIFILNKKLLGVIKNIGIDIVNFANEYNYSIPSNLRNYVDEAEKLMYELNHPTSISKKCSVCNKLNPENAEFCCYCGSSMVITRIRHSDKSPVNATEYKTVNFIYTYINNC